MTGCQKRVAGTAVASRLLGILGLSTVWLCGIGALFAIPAVICGHIGYARIKKSGDELAGGGLVVAGLITGYASIGLLLLVIPICAAIGFPLLADVRTRSTASSCHENLQELGLAMEHCRLANPNVAITSMVQIAGPSGSLKAPPHCKGGGIYLLPASLDGRTSCSIHGELPE